MEIILLFDNSFPASATFRLVLVSFLAVDVADVSTSPPGSDVAAAKVSGVLAMMMVTSVVVVKSRRRRRLVVRKAMWETIFHVCVRILKIALIMSSTRRCVSAARNPAFSSTFWRTSLPCFLTCHCRMVKRGPT